MHSHIFHWSEQVVRDLEPHSQPKNFRYLASNSCLAWRSKTFTKTQQSILFTLLAYLASLLPFSMLSSNKACDISWNSAPWFSQMDWYCSSVVVKEAEWRLPYDRFPLDIWMGSEEKMQPVTWMMIVVSRKCRFVVDTLYHMIKKEVQSRHSRMGHTSSLVLCWARNSSSWSCCCDQESGVSEKSIALKELNGKEKINLEGKGEK